MKESVLYNLFLFIVSISLFNCGFALTPRLTAKFPLETKTEVFRLNLFHGKFENLYGLNVGIFNFVNNMIGAQVGIVNSSSNKTSGWQFA
ncbi:LA_2272/LA_2273 family lipoprotein, partial [Leptospira borgpetersenii]|uniref:LA_2272/LA_2273 family lipoprotein n=2 Tax=Leptospira borgpetersenii TaxID=174 RepID=UPI0003700229